MSPHTMTSPQGLEAARERFMTAIAENRFWFVLLGFLTVVAGVAALAHPIWSSIAIELFIGSLFVAVGIATVFAAFAARNWSGFFLQFIVGLFYVAAGGFLIARPVEGTAVLTLAAGSAFVADGIVRLVWTSQMPRGSAWGWVLFSGIVAIVVGIALLIGFAQAAPYALGVLAGANFLVTGWATMTLAIIASRPDEKPEATGNS